jgi:hypothetical protein
MKRVFEITSAHDLKDQIATLIEHMESDHRDHRRFVTTKRELAVYDGIIGILEGLGSAIRTAEIRTTNALAQALAATSGNDMKLITKQEGANGRADDDV